MTEPRTQGQLQKQLQALQEAWLHTLGQLGKRRALVHTVLQVRSTASAASECSGRTARGSREHMRSCLLWPRLKKTLFDLLQGGIMDT